MDSEPVQTPVQSESGSTSKILGLLPMFLIFVVIILRITWVLYRSATGQKTRNTQARRVYVPGSRQRLPSTQGEPTIFVSPANLPPPPKYEAMAPPSYEEVMGIHYPIYQTGQQPITQPLTHALAQGSTSNSETTPNNVTINVTNNVSRSNDSAPENASDAPAIVTVTTEQRRTSVAVRAS